MLCRGTRTHFPHLPWCLQAMFNMQVRVRGTRGLGRKGRDATPGFKRASVHRVWAGAPLWGHHTRHEGQGAEPGRRVRAPGLVA